MFAVTLLSNTASKIDSLKRLSGTLLRKIVQPGLDSLVSGADYLTSLTEYQIQKIIMVLQPQPACQLCIA
jgi:hypothetical protein